VKSSVVVPVDPFDDCEFEFTACSPWSMECDEFGFEPPVERFCHRIIVLISDGSDRCGQTDNVETVGVTKGRILRTGVAVMRATVGNLALPGCHF